MDGIEDLWDRGDLFLRVLGEQDQCKEMAMAKNGNDKDMPTGKQSTDNAQMKALKQAHGTPVRKSELPPYVGKDKMPGETD